MKRKERRRAASAAVWGCKQQQDPRGHRRMGSPQKHRACFFPAHQAAPRLDTDLSGTLEKHTISSPEHSETPLSPLLFHPPPWYFYRHSNTDCHFRHRLLSSFSGRCHSVSLEPNQFVRAQDNITPFFLVQSAFARSNRSIVDWGLNRAGQGRTGLDWTGQGKKVQQAPFASSVSVVECVSKQRGKGKKLRDEQ